MKFVVIGWKILVLSSNSTSNWYKWYNPTTTGLPANFNMTGSERRDLGR